MSKWRKIWIRDVFWPQHLKTRLESRIKKFPPRCACRYKLKVYANVYLYWMKKYSVWAFGSDIGTASNMYGYPDSAPVFRRGNVQKCDLSCIAHNV